MKKLNLVTSIILWICITLLVGIGFQCMVMLNVPDLSTYNLAKWALQILYLMTLVMLGFKIGAEEKD